MNIENLNLDDLKSLSKEEQETVLKILKEYSLDGSSKLFNDLKYADYKEIPVDIETFLNDDRYLGKAWKDVRGNSKVYPFWLEQLKKLFPNNTDTNYNILLETGARGIGKSEVAVGIICIYLMYRVMCLKNARDFYNIKSTEKICFAFMNITKDLAEGIALDKFQKNVQQSSWFMSKGSMTTYNNEPYWIPPEPIEIIIGSQPSHVVGLPIFFAFFDEISFIRNQDIDKQKQKAKDMIDTARGGMLTRFVFDGKNPTLLCVASSKRSEQSFMENYIRILEETDKANILVVDQPVWKVKPAGTYGDGVFYIALGDKYKANVIIKNEEDIPIYKSKQYKIIDVPLFFKAKFEEDLDRNLCDIAGISTMSSNKYISVEQVDACINTEFSNPFPDVLEIGNGPDDKRQYYNFFDLTKVPNELKSKPLYVHLDMSLTGDMTGIAGVWIIGKKPSVDEKTQSRDLSFRVAFSTSIKAPKGRQISFEKNRIFIRWLKQVGFNVKEITSDTFQSYDLQQQLSAEGFTCSILSVDRVDKDQICKPYQYLKNTLYEKRIIMYKSERLYDEFLDVERNINTGKVDHTPNFHKDVLDAVCGATFTASKHAEEFAYDYGESLSTILDVNLGSQEAIRKQMTVDFEEELKNMLMQNHLPQPENQGNGLLKYNNIPDAKEVADKSYINIANGIMVW